MKKTDTTSIEYSKPTLPTTKKVSLRQFIQSWGIFFVFALCLLFSVTKKASADSAPSEYQVKAAFLYNFGRFVNWPTGTFAEANSPFIIGVVGRDPFGASLDKAVSGKTMTGHPIVIRRFRRVSDIEQCHVLFISDSERERLAKVLDRAEGRAILTVSEIDGFTARGGMINFVIESKKVRFDINAVAAQRVRLRISAKLLQLARNKVTG
jgi:hypothetical protein